MYNLEEFIQPTYYCDYKHPAIQVIIKRFRNKYSKIDELAEALFYFVRDHIHYRVGYWNKKASETLRDRNGTCTNSANLLVAFYRAANIPAGYGLIEVIGNNYFGPIALRKLTKNVSRKSKHIYCYVFLNNKWIKCDPSDDEILSINTQHLNPQSLVVNWNKNGDAMLSLEKKHVLNNTGPHANIDYIIKKKQRMSLYIPTRIANLYINFLRQYGSKMLNLEMLEPEFLKWLRINHKIDFCFYKIFIHNLICCKQNIENLDIG